MIIAQFNINIIFPLNVFTLLKNKKKANFPFLRNRNLKYDEGPQICCRDAQPAFTVILSRSGFAGFEVNFIQKCYVQIIFRKSNI